MSKAEEFLLKEQTYEEKVVIDEARVVTIRVSRTRTSAGQAAIFLKIGDNKRIELSNDATTYGDAYSNVAAAIVALLTRALDNPCQLPQT
jgi:hypothetical protein